MHGRHCISSELALSWAAYHFIQEWEAELRARAGMQMALAVLAVPALMLGVYLGRN